MAIDVAKCDMVVLDLQLFLKQGVVYKKVALDHAAHGSQIHGPSHV